jgi:hypothetical protein
VKLTKQQLKQIIKEEISKVLKEDYEEYGAPEYAEGEKPIVAAMETLFNALAPLSFPKQEFSVALADEVTSLRNRLNTLMRLDAAGAPR